MADGIIFEQHGVKAAAIITDAFVLAANAMARRYGLPGYRYAMLPHPVENLSREQSRERVASVMDDVLSILGLESQAAPATAAGAIEEPGDIGDGAGSIEDLTADAIERVAHRSIEYYYDMGWTDGLPVVPPTPRRVEAMIERAREDPGRVLVQLEHLGRQCTVEQAAVNAVMAGCTDEMFPVVLAAVQALKGPLGGGILQSTTGQSQLVIVNGPVRSRLGFNSGGGALGPGFRANATIGRALRLIIMNALGVRPHEFDQATQGTPSQQGFCIAENEEESPWEPLHVEKGFAAGDSTVTAGLARSTLAVENRISNDPEEIMRTIADSMSYAGVWHRGAARGCTVIMGPVHARILAGGGWTKQAVKEYLYERFGRRLGELRSWGPYNRDVVNRGNYEEGPDEHFLRYAGSPDAIQIVVAGAGSAGLSTVVPSAPNFVTTAIDGGR